MPTTLSVETIPQIARRLNAPVWKVRRLADRLAAEAGQTLPRVSFLVRLIDADLAAKIEAALAEGVADAE